MNTFLCKHEKNTWGGYISAFKNYGTHCEFKIQSRSGIMVIFGRTSQGYFACMPDFGVGCHLSELNDVFWNTERLAAVLGIVDGVTVAQALQHLYREPEYPKFK